MGQGAWCTARAAQMASGAEGPREGPRQLGLALCAWAHQAQGTAFSAASCHATHVVTHLTPFLLPEPARPCSPQQSPTATGFPVAPPFRPPSALGDRRPL